MRRPSRARAAWLGLAVGAGLFPSACERVPGPDPELLPDSVLRAELGLGDTDQVHRVELRGGEREELTPAHVNLAEGHWVEFVTADWRVHAVRFETDSLPPEALAFMAESDQLESPPLVELGARFVVSFGGAPEGRYPFVAEGNTAPSRGVVVVHARR